MLQATERDDRGAEGVHFGFIYFNDGRRVGYTVPKVYDLVVHPDATGQGWPAVTQEHVTVALKFLRDEGLDV